MCIAIDEMREDARKEGWNSGRISGKNEGIIEGRDEGIILGRMQTLSDLVKDGILTLADAAKRAGLSPAEFQKKTAEMK